MLLVLKQNQRIRQIPEPTCSVFSILRFRRLAFSTKMHSNDSHLKRNRPEVQTYFCFQIWSV